MPTIHELIPSSILKDEEDNSVITVNGKKYYLLGRDPWKAYMMRWYWFDWYLVRAVDWWHSWRGKSRGEELDVEIELECE